MMQAVAALLDGSHLATADELPRVIELAAERLGWTAAVYLVDVEQQLLLHLTAPDEPATRPPESVASTLAWSYFPDSINCEMLSIFDDPGV